MMIDVISYRDYCYRDDRRDPITKHIGTFDFITALGMVHPFAAVAWDRDIDQDHFPSEPFHCSIGLWHPDDAHAWGILYIAKNSCTELTRIFLASREYTRARWAVTKDWSRSRQWSTSREAKYLFRAWHAGLLIEDP